MGNLGMGEIMIVMVIALLVIGPKRLPEIARNLGKAWRTFQTETQKASAVFREAIDEVQDKPGSTVAKPAAAAVAPPVAAVTSPPPDVDPTVRQLEDT